MKIEEEKTAAELKEEAIFGNDENTTQHLFNEEELNKYTNKVIEEVLPSDEEIEKFIIQGWLDCKPAVELAKNLINHIKDKLK